MVCTPPESDQKSTLNTSSPPAVFWSSLWNKLNCPDVHEQRIQFGKVVFLVVMLVSYRRSDIQISIQVRNNTHKKLNTTKLLRS